MHRNSGNKCGMSNYICSYSWNSSISDSFCSLYNRFGYDYTYKKRRNFNNLSLDYQGIVNKFPFVDLSQIDFSKILCKQCIHSDAQSYKLYQMQRPYLPQSGGKYTQGTLLEWPFFKQGVLAPPSALPKSIISPNEFIPISDFPVTQPDVIPAPQPTLCTQGFGIQACFTSQQARCTLIQTQQSPQDVDKIYSINVAAGKAYVTNSTSNNVQIAVNACNCQSNAQYVSVRLRLDKTARTGSIVFVPKGSSQPSDAKYANIIYIQLGTITRTITKTKQKHGVKSSITLVVNQQQCSPVRFVQPLDIPQVVLPEIQQKACTQGFGIQATLIDKSGNQAGTLIQTDNSFLPKFKITMQAGTVQVSNVKGIVNKISKQACTYNVTDKTNSYSVILKINAARTYCYCYFVSYGTRPSISTDELLIDIGTVTRTVKDSTQKILVDGKQVNSTKRVVTLNVSQQECSPISLVQPPQVIVPQISQKACTQGLGIKAYFANSKTTYSTQSNTKPSVSYSVQIQSGKLKYTSSTGKTQQISISRNTFSCSKDTLGILVEIAKKTYGLQATLITSQYSRSSSYTYIDLGTVTRTQTKSSVNSSKLWLSTLNVSQQECSPLLIMQPMDQVVVPQVIPDQCSTGFGISATFKAGGGTIAYYQTSSQPTPSYKIEVKGGSVKYVNTKSKGATYTVTQTSLQTTASAVNVVLQINTTRNRANILFEQNGKTNRDTSCTYVDLGTVTRNATRSTVSGSTKWAVVLSVSQQECSPVSIVQPLDVEIPQVDVVVPQVFTEQCSTGFGIFTEFVGGGTLVNTEGTQDFPAYSIQVHKGLVKYVNSKSKNVSYIAQSKSIKTSANFVNILVQLSVDQKYAAIIFQQNGAVRRKSDCSYIDLGTVTRKATHSTVQGSTKWAVALYVSQQECSPVSLVEPLDIQLPDVDVVVPQVVTQPCSAGFGITALYKDNNKTLLQAQGASQPVKHYIVKVQAGTVSYVQSKSKQITVNVAAAQMDVYSTKKAKVILQINTTSGTARTRIAINQWKRLNGYTYIDLGSVTSTATKSTQQGSKKWTLALVVSQQECSPVSIVEPLDVEIPQVDVVVPEIKQTACSQGFGISALFSSNNSTLADISSSTSVEASALAYNVTVEGGTLTYTRSASQKFNVNVSAASTISQQSFVKVVLDLLVTQIKNSQYSTGKGNILFATPSSPITKISGHTYIDVGTVTKNITKSNVTGSKKWKVSLSISQQECSPVQIVQPKDIDISQLDVEIPQSPYSVCQDTGAVTAMFLDGSTCTTAKNRSYIVSCTSGTVTIQQYPCTDQNNTNEICWSQVTLQSGFQATVSKDSVAIYANINQEVDGSYTLKYKVDEAPSYTSEGLSHFHSLVAIITRSTSSDGKKSCLSINQVQCGPIALHDTRVPFIQPPSNICQGGIGISAKFDKNKKTAIYNSSEATLPFTVSIQKGSVYYYGKSLEVEAKTFKLQADIQTVNFYVQVTRSDSSQPPKAQYKKYDQVSNSFQKRSLQYIGSVTQTSKQYQGIDLYYLNLVTQQTQCGPIVVNDPMLDPQLQSYIDPLLQNQMCANGFQLGASFSNGLHYLNDNKSDIRWSLTLTQGQVYVGSSDSSIQPITGWKYPQSWPLKKEEEYKVGDVVDVYLKIKQASDSSYKEIKVCKVGEPPCSSYQKNVSLHYLGTVKSQEKGGYSYLSVSQGQCSPILQSTANVNVNETDVAYMLNTLNVVGDFVWGRCAFGFGIAAYFGKGEDATTHLPSNKKYPEYTINIKGGKVYDVTKDGMATPIKVQDFKVEGVTRQQAEVYLVYTTKGNPRGIVTCAYAQGIQEYGAGWHIIRLGTVNVKHSKRASDIVVTQLQCAPYYATNVGGIDLDDSAQAISSSNKIAGSNDTSNLVAGASNGDSSLDIYVRKSNGDSTYYNTIVSCKDA